MDLANLKFTEGVAVLQGKLKILTDQLIDAVIDEAKRRNERVARINFHASNEELVQEMIIAMCRGILVPAHSHPHKSESFHLISGKVKVGFLNDAFELDRVVTLADEGCKFYRSEPGLVHVVVPMTEVVVIHETTRGPFDRTSASHFPEVPELETIRRQIVEHE